eukprot:CAMPEP_0195531724 /NCGR_PEP_ID=MMETSP0794_2-20130614/36137_1 /TAXON_ID=515487 /ORGANISM="Stephanopyxis turris, Strain CCMP 815" /LENGTH=180 /DNA_ID=CAMNT_0040663625 /DNA_START=62 /DNA_END=601 /DNA_ORIENTATION=-
MLKHLVGRGTFDLDRINLNINQDETDSEGDRNDKVPKQLSQHKSKFDKLDKESFSKRYQIRHRSTFSALEAKCKVRKGTFLTLLLIIISVDHLYRRPPVVDSVTNDILDQPRKVGQSSIATSAVAAIPAAYSVFNDILDPRHHKNDDTDNGKSGATSTVPLFWHIPKSGGSTMKEILSSC